MNDNVNPSAGFIIQVEDEAALLSNTNKLLTAVGISAKRITSTEELSRVASSLFVAVYESLFHEKIIGVIRAPKSVDDYENNAQLVIDSLSDQIQLDLKHISGKSIVTRDIRVLSNLVHILLRIVSLTGQESLTTYDSSIYAGGEPHYMQESLSTRESHFGDERNDNSPYLYKNTGLNDFMGNIKSAVKIKQKENVLSEDTMRNIAKVEIYLNFEKKMDVARRRREWLTYLKESSCRAANMKHMQTASGIKQKRWLDDVNRDHNSHILRKSNEEHVILRKAYSGVLKQVNSWRMEQQREAQNRSKSMKEMSEMHVQSLMHQFEDRLRLLSELDAAESRDEKIDLIKLRETIIQGTSAKYTNLIEIHRNKIQQHREREMLKRRELQKQLLSSISSGGWKELLRNYLPQ